MKKRFSFLIKLYSYILDYIIDKRVGKISSELEVVVENGRLVLNARNVNYSYGSLYDLFHVTFKQLHFNDRKINTALILGFGAGSIASLLTETFHKDCYITGVDADEVVIELAKKHFNIERFKKLKIYVDDAYQFVLNSKEKYDLIAVDIFIDNYTPPHFSDTIFLSKFVNILSPSGLICYNRMASNPKARKEADDLLQLFNQQIGSSYMINFENRGYNNRMIIYDRASLKI